MMLMSEYITPVMYSDPNGESVVGALIFLFSASLVFYIIYGSIVAQNNLENVVSLSCQDDLNEEVKTTIILDNLAYEATLKTVKSNLLLVYYLRFAGAIIPSKYLPGYKAYLNKFDSKNYDDYINSDLIPAVELSAYEEEHGIFFSESEKDYYFKRVTYWGGYFAH